MSKLEWDVGELYEDNSGEICKLLWEAEENRCEHQRKINMEKYGVSLTDKEIQDEAFAWIAPKINDIFDKFVTEIDTRLRDAPNSVQLYFREYISQTIGAFVKFTVVQAV